MTRPRSNALGGPNDPRFPRADKQLAAQFANPIPMAKELETFLQTVFARRDLMTWNDLAHKKDERLSDKIYELYSSSGGGGPVAKGKATIVVARDVWGQIHKLIGGRWNMQAQFQYQGVTLKDILASKSDVQILRACDDFLYFSLVKLPPAFRVYLNLDFASMPALVSSVLGLERRLYGQVAAFKICGPGAARADSVVIYCISRSAAEGIAAKMAELIKQSKLVSKNQSVPAMTTRLAPGVAIGAEPAQQATGLGAKPQGYAESAQSFGTIRSELIAGAIFSYQDNLRTLGEGFNTFRQLVAIAFKGYGLDPARPGD